MLLSPLPAKTYLPPAPEVARSLLGARLVRRINGKRIAGIITEAEGYYGETDLGCHARAGRTPRTEVMYGPPGCAYVYFIYGMYWMLNCVTGPEGSPAAVLIRAIHPTEGLDEIALRRPGVAAAKLTDGPGKVCKALAIDGSFNKCDLTDPTGELFIEPGTTIPDEQVITGPRVGLDSVPEPWRSIPWRFRVSREFFLQGNHHSKRSESF